ncbi:hypothetical protein AKO1_008620, partial [Acrasis kona]
KHERREEARERYHDELLGLHDKEAADGNKQEKDEKHLQEVELMQKANVAGADTLFAIMFSTDPEAKNIEIISDRISEFTINYRDKFNSLLDTFRSEMLNNLKMKTNELEELDSTLMQSQLQNNNISKQLLKSFEKKKKQVLNSVKEVSESEEEDLKLLDELSKSLHSLGQQLIEIELNQTEAFAEVIEEFITNYKDLDCQEIIRTFFGNCRQAEQSYHLEVQSKLLQDADNKDKLDLNESTAERIREFLEDKDQVLNILQRSTEAHLTHIQTQEEILTKNEETRMKSQLEKVKLDEHARNRSRISEIHSFVERVKEEINEVYNFYLAGEETNQ